MTEKEKNELARDVMAQIESRRLSMRPKIYFVLLSILLGLGVAAAFLVALFFAIRLTVQFNILAPHDFLRLGHAGLVPFFFTLPWLSMIVALVGLGGGIFLLKKYDFSYKQKFLPLAAGLIAAVVVIGLVIGALAFKHDIHERPDSGRFLKPTRFERSSEFREMREEVNGIKGLRKDERKLPPLMYQLHEKARR